MTNIYTKSILGGVAIGIGGFVYLSVGGGVVGAFLFSIGLLSILIFDLYLFTGKVCYVKWKYESIIDVLFILSGNILGSWASGVLLSFARPDLIEFAHALCEKKLSESWRVLILGVFCNVIIFFAVDIWKRYGFYSTAFVTLCVMVFILSGMEHSIANTFFFVYGCKDVPFDRVAPYLLMNIVGNSFGGIISYQLIKENKNV